MAHEGHHMPGGHHDIMEGHHNMHMTTTMPPHMDHSEHHGDGHEMEHGSHNMMEHMMKMWFHFGYTERAILFDSWSINSIGGLLGSMLGIFFLAALYEGLKYYREYLFWKTYNSLQYRAVSLPATKNNSEDNQVVQPTMLNPMHFFQTFLHIIQMVVSYFLMLIFMTFNVWLCLAVVAGDATGYFLFGWKKSVIVDVTEHCH